MGGSVAVIFLIVLLVRYLDSRRRSGGASFSIPTWIGVCVAKLFLTLIVIGFTAAMGAGELLLPPLLVLMWAPTIVVRWIAVPLRMPRVAHWIISSCRPLTLARESDAAGVMYGALALARKGASDAASEWLRQRLAGARPLRGAGVVAAGLLAARRGDGHRARCLFRIADTSSMTPRAARVIARDWLVADAAQSGDWREVVRLGRRGSDSLRWSYAMARIAERLIGDPRACSDWLLWPCFLLAPRRRATFALLRRALAAPVRTSPPSEASPADAADLPQALADLARAIGNAHVHDASSLARCVGAVDRHIESMRAGIEQRLNTLGSRGSADAVISAFGRRLVDLVAPVIEADPRLALAAERGPSFERAIAQVRLRLFRDVEVQCRDYKEQKEPLLDAPFEWERWAVLRNAADRVLTLDPAAEGALFLTMYAPVCNFAVFQHNKHSRYSLAHDMFIWLLQHAGSDTQARQLLAKNAAAGGG